jgi:cytidylate kinase
VTQKFVFSNDFIRTYHKRYDIAITDLTCYDVLTTGNKVRTEAVCQNAVILQPTAYR